MAENLRLERVALGANDIDVTASWLDAQAGLRSTESWLFRSGLANRMVYSGAAAIEILGIGFPGAEMISPFAAQVSGRTIAGDRWLTWAIATDDIGATARRLGLEVMDGWAMSVSSGQEVTWRMAGVVEAFFAEPYLPYFVSYTNGEDAWHERARRPDPAFDVTRIQVSGDPGRLHEWLGGASLPVAVTPGPPGIDSVAITTDRGTIDLAPRAT